MNLKEINIKSSLNKAYRLVKPKRPEIETFKTNLIKLLSQIDEKESEENVKIHLMDFLKETWYKQDYLVATKGRTDFVIHTGKDAKAPSGVLFEVKRPTNKADMVSRKNLNAKAMHELILYFLRERITEKNIDIRHLVITNIYEWFIFDASVFEKVVAKNTKLVKAFKDWNDGQKVSTNTDLFYKEIAKPFIDELKEDIAFTWFDIREYEKPLQNNDKADDNKLIALFKIFSPIHLLKIQFANDSNSLDKGFYAELLHIIGLEEVKDGSKKVIRRKQEGKRDAGSLLENTITILDTEDSIHKVPDISGYGDNRQDRLFNLALELCITWVNRVLFLKLLEAQLIKYHKGDQSFRFLNYTKIPQYDELYKLFFQVLAKRQADRSAAVNKKFENIPYLNSSLFEICELEDQTIKINSLDDAAELDLYSGTVLRNDKNKSVAKCLNSLQYLFDFLDAYDFASEGSEEIQEESKTLINASVLGLIFEKINGYKDGSIFTPGFITMYMCRQTIRLAVLQKFKEAYGWKCDEFEDLKNYMADRRTAKDILEFNKLINGMHLCDPAVGSGHFLVSSLNEIIAIKAELGILADDKGVRLSGFDIEIENDELIVTYNEGQDIFEYQVNNGSINKEVQRVQKTLFHEKQTIIENCLFGVDINPNSVKICRLRLWIELLKNAYYTEESKFKELETLPNIDINIKCGNSLISRFALDADLSKALKSIKYNIDQYKGFVHDYKNAHDKELKRGLEQIINSIKNDFRVEISNNSKEFKDLSKWKGELINLTMQTGLFEKTPKEKKEFDLEVKKLTEKIAKQETLIEEIKSNVIYRNAFEWRFEFPEVLDKDGNFEGFDVIVGNPPYVFARENFDNSTKDYYSNNYKTSQYQVNLFFLFIEKTILLLKYNASYTLIVPNSLLMVSSAQKLRELILNESRLNEIINLIGESFEGVNVETIIVSGTKGKDASESHKVKVLVSNKNEFELMHEKEQNLFVKNEGFELNVFSDQDSDALTSKFIANTVMLDDIVEIKAGLQAYETGKGNPKQTPEDVKSRPYDYSYKFDDSTYKYLEGKDVCRYHINWNGQYLKYGEHLAAPRTLSLFNGKKIIIREITSKPPYAIIAAYSEDLYLFNRSNIAIVEKENSKVDLKYILAILNSKLMSYYFMKNTAKSVRQLFPKLILQDLRKFPIKQIEISKQKPFIRLVDQIQKELEKNSSADISTYEQQIDEMVYKLYDLTEEEIKIIEVIN